MDPAAERHRVRDLLQQSQVAILLTFGSGQAHAGRPMLPLWLSEDSHIYFLTHRESQKVSQVNERPHVALTVISAGCYLVVLGLAYGVSGSRSNPPPMASELSGAVSKGLRRSGGHGASDGHQQSELLGPADEPLSPVVPSSHSSCHETARRDCHEDD
jgi:hypothetical protein